MQFAPLEINVGGFGHQHANITVALEDRTQRVGDLAGRQRARGDLVGERLEQMEVAPVDEGDLRGRPPQLERSLETAKPAPNDHHTVHVLPTH